MHSLQRIRQGACGAPYVDFGTFDGVVTGCPLLVGVLKLGRFYFVALSDQAVPELPPLRSRQKSLCFYQL